MWQQAKAVLTREGLSAILSFGRQYQSLKGIAHKLILVDTRKPILPSVASDWASGIKMSAKCLHLIIQLEESRGPQSHPMCPSCPHFEYLIIVQAQLRIHGQ